jgi:hypothetical protein
MEWMDPMSWRLPSGQALAEFALQAGFLAPLIMGVPGVRKRPPTRRVTNGAPPVELPGPFTKQDERASVDRDPGGTRRDGE